MSKYGHTDPGLPQTYGAGPGVPRPVGGGGGGGGSMYLTVNGGNVLTVNGGNGVTVNA